MQSFCSFVKNSNEQLRKQLDMSVTVELRGPCPKDTVDVIDAVAHAKRLDRTAMVNRILSEWAEQKLHEAKTIARVVRGNPALRKDMDEEWK